MERGAAVEVRCTYNGNWSSGFEVVEETNVGYRLRRVSDGTQLPREFPRDEVRKH
jgi:hypothetical protein